MGQRRLVDPKALRALAHPVRVAILEVLSARGPLTASELADVVGESPSNCSWHLRKLAEFELVEEADPVPGRRRPWRATDTTIAISADEASRVGREAARDVEAMLLQRALDRFLAASTAGESDDRREAHFTREALWLTPEEARELRQSVDALLDRYRDRGDIEQRPSDADLMELVAWQAPFLLGVEPDEH